MRDVYIIGVGQTKRGWFPGRGLASLAAEAGYAATDDADVPMIRWNRLVRSLPPRGFSTNHLRPGRRGGSWIVRQGGCEECRARLRNGWCGAS